MKAEAWLTLRGKAKSWGSPFPQGSPYEGQMPLEKVTITKITQSKPQCGPDEIAVRVEFEVDEGWFLSGVFTVKAAMAAPPPQHEIQAHVDLPVKPRGKSAAAAVLNHP